MISDISERHVLGLNGETGLQCGYWLSDGIAEGTRGIAVMRDAYWVTMVRLALWWAQLVISVISERHVPGLNGETCLVVGTASDLCHLCNTRTWSHW